MQRRWIYWSDKELKIVISSITVQVECMAIGKVFDRCVRDWFELILIVCLCEANLSSSHSSTQRLIYSLLPVGMLLPVAVSSRPSKASRMSDEKIFSQLCPRCVESLRHTKRPTYDHDVLFVDKTKQRIRSELRSDVIIVDEADTKEAEARRKCTKKQQFNVGSDFTSWCCAKGTEKRKNLHILNVATLPNQPRTCFGGRNFT